MIYDVWNEKQNEWENKDVAYIFGISVPQLYRIIKNQIKEAKVAGLADTGRRKK